MSDYLSFTALLSRNGFKYEHNSDGVFYYISVLRESDGALITFTFNISDGKLRFIE